MSLTEDVEELQKNPGLESKLRITHNITRLYNAGILTPKEKKIAIDVIRILVSDLEVAIRQALANNLKHNPEVPKDVILHLAQDIEEVSVPVLEVSRRLSQRDLVDIVRSTKKVMKWIAVARREDVKKPLSRVLAETRHEEVIATLITNIKAEIADDVITQIVEDYHRSESIMHALINRGGLSIAVVSRICDVVTDNLKEQLIQWYKLPASAVAKAGKESKEKTALALLNAAGHQRQTEQFIKYLHNSNQLTRTILFRALCKGDLMFFEMGLAKLAKISNKVAHKLAWEQGPAGFAMLYKMAGMPKGMFEPINVILRLAQEEYMLGTLTEPGFASRMVKKITNSGYDKKISIMPFFMVLIKSRLNTIDIYVAKQSESAK